MASNLVEQKLTRASQASSLSGISAAMVSPSKPDSSPKKNAKGKGKVVGSDVGLDNDEEGRVAPSRRPSSVRQEIIAKDPKYFRKQQAAKAKADLQATLRAGDATGATDTEPETKTKPARKPASQPPAMNKSSTTSKRPTTKTSGPAASRSTKAATIQKGNITKPTKVKESKRKHRKVDYDYDSVPDESDEEAGKSKTIAKLRETIDRHARWCPFVRLNKKLHRTHRRVKRLETSDSEEDDAIAEPEEDGDEDAVPEVDQSDAESDEVEDVQPSKKTQSKPNAKKVASKQTVLKKGKAAAEAASSKEVAFDLSNEQDETPGGMQPNDDSDIEANQPESEDGNDMAAVPAVITLDSDEELSSLDESKVEQLQEAHEHEQQDLNKQADDSAPGRDASKQKGKRVDVEAGEGMEGPIKKQRRLS